MYSLLWCADMFIAEVSRVYEPTKAVLQSRPHPNALTRTATIIKVLPNLQMYDAFSYTYLASNGKFVCMRVCVCVCARTHMSV